ncbi:MAG: hypothetical protein Q9212_006960, partial [Teloschistes hypoglaucus]
SKTPAAAPARKNPARGEPETEVDINDQRLQDRQFELLPEHDNPPNTVHTMEVADSQQPSGSTPTLHDTPPEQLQGPLGPPIKKSLNADFVAALNLSET